jgi:hypothetical protein
MDMGIVPVVSLERIVVVESALGTVEQDLEEAMRMGNLRASAKGRWREHHAERGQEQ